MPFAVPHLPLPSVPLSPPFGYTPPLAALLTLCEAGLWVQRLLRLQLHGVHSVSRGAYVYRAALRRAETRGLHIELLRGRGRGRVSGAGVAPP